MNIYMQLIEPTLNLFRNHMPEFISILALFLTIYQAILSREHNRLSVKPSLTTHVDIDSPTNSSLLFQASLSNCGLGPAIVKSYGIFDGSSIHYPFEPKDFGELVYKGLGKFGQALNLEESKFFVLRTEAVIGANEKLVMAEISINIDPNTDVDSIMALLNKFHLVIEYESAYKEQLIYDSRNHVVT